MDTFVAWVQATHFSQAIVGSLWVWPLCETIHFIGLSLIVGVVGLFDLRLMGFFADIPVAAIRRLMPAAIVGFLCNLTTGIVFLAGHPEQYAHNIAWWAKVSFLAIAGLNAVIFEKAMAQRIFTAPAPKEMPLAAKMIGAVSLVAWIGVLYWGRMLPFIGDAY